jgi:hypothetical protein
VLHLWLPKPLIELANRQVQPRVVRTHEDLRRFLELQDQEDLWYALTMRAHQVDRAVSEVTYIRRPYREPEHFPELRAVLARVAGAPPRNPTENFSTASVSILAGESLKGKPRDVISKLLVFPPPAVVLQGAR